MNHVIKKKAYWSEQNAQWESSGLAQKQFCEQRGLGYRQFVYWRGRLNQKGVEKANPKLMRVLPSSAHQLPQAIVEPTPCLEVILPTGIKPHIKTEADISKAGSLIKLLGGAR